MARHFGPSATPPPDDEVHLRLVKTHDREVICDQKGRMLDGVVGFRYEQTTVDGPALLTVKVYVQPCEWKAKLGVIKGGEEARLDASSFGLEPPQCLDTE
jgi:hypothetical protein